MYTPVTANSCLDPFLLFTQTLTMLPTHSHASMSRCPTSNHTLPRRDHGLGPTARSAGPSPAAPSRPQIYIELLLIHTPTTDTNPHDITYMPVKTCNTTHPASLPTFKHELATILHYYTIYCSRTLSARPRACLPSSPAPHCARRTTNSSITPRHSKETASHILLPRNTARYQALPPSGNANIVPGPIADSQVAKLCAMYAALRLSPAATSFSTRATMCLPYVYFFSACRCTRIRPSSSSRWDSSHVSSTFWTT